jgi:hypothetical protein
MFRLTRKNRMKAKEREKNLKSESVREWVFLWGLLSVSEFL